MSNMSIIDEIDWVRFRHPDQARMPIKREAEPGNDSPRVEGIKFARKRIRT